MVPTRRPPRADLETGAVHGAAAHRVARGVAVGLALGIAVTVAGCGHPSTPPAPPSGSGTTQSAHPAPTPTPTLDTTDPAALTKALEKAVAAQKTVHVSGPITQRGQSMKVTADLRGLGDPDLTATTTSDGVAPSHITVKDGTFYLDIGPHVNNRYLIVEPGEADSPLGEGYGGFVDQINPLTLTQGLRSATAVVPDAAVASVGGEPVQGYTLTVTRTGMKKILTAQVGPTALALLPKTFDVTVLVDGDGLVRRASWDVKGAATTLTYTKWGEKVVVAKPPNPVAEHVLFP